MKTFIRIFTVLALVSSSYVINAQQIGDLDGINYQAVAIDEDGKEIVGMDVEGKPLHEKTIGVRFSILTGSDGPILYQETQTAQTDRYGLFSLVIGKGELTGEGLYDTLLNMPWIDADQWLKVELSTKNDGNFLLVSLQKFMTVPYSFYTDDIADNAITTAKILNETILAEDIGTGSVETSEILDETILAEDIHESAVETSEILNETILSEDIKNETILPEDIGTGSVETSEILDETILAEDIGTGSVETSEILDETILAEDIGTGSVATSEILNETILAEDIGTGSVATSEILNETILAQDIGTGSVETSEILDETILNEDIADDAINLTEKVTAVLPVPNGGTGVATSTSGGVLIGQGTNPVQALPQATDMQIVVGVTGGDPVLKELKAGEGITFTNYADSIVVTSIFGLQNNTTTVVKPKPDPGKIKAGETWVSNPIKVPGVDGDLVLAWLNKDMDTGIMTTAFDANDDLIISVYNPNAPGPGSDIDLGGPGLSATIIILQE